MIEQNYNVLIIVEQDKIGDELYVALYKTYSVNRSIESYTSISKETYTENGILETWLRKNKYWGNYCSWANDEGYKNPESLCARKPILSHINEFFKSMNLPYYVMTTFAKIGIETELVHGV